MSIERKVEEAILSKDMIVSIGNDKYRIKRPTIATLIAVSAEISELPTMEIRENKQMIDIVRNAKHYDKIGMIFAIMIRGYRNDEGWLKSILNRSRNKKLAKRILNSYTPRELAVALASVFSKMEVKDFFVLTTSLSEVNVIKRTVEVD